MSNKEPKERCECGNQTAQGAEHCEWCAPHEHVTPANAHAFSSPAGICQRCRLLAMDCCERMTECPGSLDNFKLNGVSRAHARREAGQ